MRIAHVITRMIIGGAQENTLLTCRDLMREHGDEVLLITGPAIGPEGSLMDRVRAAGVPFVELPLLRRAIHPWRDLRALRTIKRALRDFTPDVVHTHSAKGGILGRAAAHALEVPAVLHTVHGAPFHPYQGRAVRAFYRRCEKYAAARCHRLISVADAMTDLMVAAGVALPEKFTTIYSGMEVEPFLEAPSRREQVRARLGYNDKHLVIGKVARLFHLKGHKYLVSAAGEIVRRFPQVRFLLVGDGILRPRIERQIERRGLAEFFQFTGRAEPEEIPGLLAATDVVVHTSLREGLARVLPQALLVGRPVVSFDIDGAREVVRPGETGLLAPPKDVGKLTRSLLTLLADETLRRRLGAAERERLAELFDHRRMTRRVRAVYLEVLKK